MAMDSAGAFALTIDQEIVGNGIASYGNFITALDASGLSLDRLAELHTSFDLSMEQDALYAWEDLEADDEEILYTDFLDLVATMLTFIQDFATEHGIELYLGYHDEDTGSVYDEVDGAFWHVDFSDVYQFTPAAEKLNARKPIAMNMFTTFG